MALTKKVTIKHRGFFNRLQEVEDKSMEQLNDYIMTGDELEVNVLNDLTQKICLYDHGPSITLFELQSFCTTLCQSVKELQKDEKEIFSHMFCAIARCKDTNFTLRDTCIMLLKPPYCVLVKFGNATTCKYLFHLGNHVLYSMGNSKDRPVHGMRMHMQPTKAFLNHFKKKR